ncbi:MAG: hypothetical protein Q4A10_07215 [Aerococcaceae bacterium]|nr:hypothetical protein [Aerococcaceae bacterium]
MKNRKLIRMLLLVSLVGGVVMTNPFAVRFSGDGRPPVVMKSF